jgi:hypothetical protein
MSGRALRSSVRHPGLHDHVGVGQQPEATRADEAGIARSRANEIHTPGRYRHRGLEAK